MLETIGLFLFIAGLIIGLGAVTVIDWHGFLARKSHYWTEATIRSHKVTKPMIWAGMVLAIIGGALLYSGGPFWGIPMWHAGIALLLILNGLFLSFSVSPYLLERERMGMADELLPKDWQRKIIFSFLISDIGWWSAVVLLVWYISTVM